MTTVQLYWLSSGPLKRGSMFHVFPVNVSNFSVDNDDPRTNWIKRNGNLSRVTAPEWLDHWNGNIGNWWPQTPGNNAWLSSSYCREGSNDCSASWVCGAGRKKLKYYQTIATFYDRIKKIDTKSVSFIISGWMNGQCPLWHLGIVTIQMRNIYPRCTNDPPLCCCWQWGKRVPKKILRLLRYNSVFCWCLQPSNNSPLTLPFLPFFWLWTISHCQYSLCY